MAVVHSADPADLLADFEAGLDGLAENDLVDEAVVDSIVRETVLHTIGGDTPWADSKVGGGGPVGGGRRRCGIHSYLLHIPSPVGLPPQVPGWTASIMEGILKRLAVLQRPMKYVCHVRCAAAAAPAASAASSNSFLCCCCRC